MANPEAKKCTFVCISTIILVVVVIITASIRIVQLNALWPSPTRVEYDKGEWVSIGTLNDLGQIDEKNPIEVRVTSASLADYEKMLEVLPDFKIQFSNTRGEPLTPEQYRVLLVEAEIRNISLEKRTFAFSQFVAESQVWRNGFDKFLFHDLNGDIPIVFMLESGETTRVTLPFIMIEQQFESVSWDQIDNRSFDLVLSLYPTLTIIQL